MFLGVPKSVITRLGWIALSFGAIQIMRLASNVILTRLLDPSVFGLISLVFAIRFGIELLSDIGVNQNIISNPRGAEPNFYDTAWTLQLFRGIVLAICCFALSEPLARFFNYPELGLILPVASLLFVMSAFDSTGRGLVQKHLGIRRVAYFEVATTLVGVIAQVALALVFRNVWSLVIGNVVASAFSLVLTFLYVPGLRHRLIIDKDCAHEIIHFGKWVFMSSIIYFLAMNFDRFYFAKQTTLAVLGVYVIARNLADIISQLVLRGSSFVLYPSVAASGLGPLELRQRLLRGRRTMLVAAAIGLGVYLACSKLIVGFLYDPRYSQAGEILPILSVGVWFAILTSCNDSILMGLSRPAYPAISNAAKLITYVVGMPVAFHYWGFMAAVVVLALGEFVKYAVLWALSHKEHLHFGRDDLLLTLTFGITAAVSVEVLRILNIGQGASVMHLRSFLAGFLR